jgi:hypothetical protein
MKVWTALALLAAMAACGPLNDGGVGQQFAEMVKGRLTGGDAAPAPVVPPEIANAAPGEVLLVTLIARNAVAPMLRQGQNGNTVTWISPGKVTMAFQDGVLVSTRGLGNDLMGVTVTGVTEAIAAGGGTSQRRHSFLDSLDQIASSDLACSITNAGSEDVVLVNGPRTLRRFVEACKGPRLVFDNTYWVDDSGTIIRSKQAISPAEGFMQVDQL